MTAADGRLAKGSTVVCTVTGNGLKDPEWAISAAPSPVTVPVDAAAAAAAPRPGLMPGASAAGGRQRANVRVPATSANLGPGSTRSVWPWPGTTTSRSRSTESGLTFDLAGEGADTAPRDESHLIIRTLRDRAGRTRRPRRAVCA